MISTLLRQVIFGRPLDRLNRTIINYQTPQPYGPRRDNSITPTLSGRLIYWSMTGDGTVAAVLLTKAAVGQIRTPILIGRCTKHDH
jgi:hypothetical protein